MSSKIEYISFGKEVDGTQYCSAVETQAENLIEDNESDAVIVYPAKDQWASLRTKEYKLTTDNAAAVLPLPIYKVKKVFLKIPSTLYIPGNFSFYLTDFKNSKGESFPLELDITDLVIEKTEWISLKQATSRYEYLTNVLKDNTFYYDVNNNEIPFLNSVYRIGPSSFGGFFADDYPTYNRLLAYILYQNGNEYEAVGGNNLAYYKLSDFLEDYGNIRDAAIDGNNLDVRTWKYRIEYVPVSSKTKLRARKSAVTTQEYIQPFNQRAEINAVSAFGKNMYLTAQKTGTPEIKVVKNYKDLSKIPPLGALVRHNGKLYRLVANSYNLYNTVFIQVTHTLSENWENRSKHVAVDQKYRNWNIPQDILWRNLYYEDYLICSSNPINEGVNGSIKTKYLTGVITNSYYGKPISYMAWFAENKEDKGVVVPISTYGTANSLVFTATFKDALSAGLSKTAVGSEYCEEALYCAKNGKLTLATVILTSGIGVGYYDFESGTFTKTEVSSEEEVQNIARECYPRIMRSSHSSLGEHKLNAPKDELFRTKFKVNKDAGEALKFTYQVHIMPSAEDVGKIIVGNKFAEINTLITRQKPSEHGLKVVYLNKYLRDGESKVIDGILSDYGVFRTDYFDGNTPYLSINQITNTDIKAWAVVDKDYNLIIGRNDTNTNIYFKCLHKRK